MLTEEKKWVIYFVKLEDIYSVAHSEQWDLD